MLVTILVIVSIILYFIYRKLDQLQKQLLRDESLYEQRLSKYESVTSTKEFLKTIIRQFQPLKEHLEQINFALNADNPAGKMSASSRRLDNLIKIYSQYLVDNSNLTKKQADVRAAFEFENFDQEKLIATLNNNYWGNNWSNTFQERKRIEKAFFQTGILEADIKETSKHIIPHDVLQPVWEVFIKQDYLSDEGTTFELGGISVESEETYRDYVKNRAIVWKLLELGIIKDVQDEKEDFWWGRPAFDFVVKDLNKIRSTVYGGGSSHEDSYFEEQYQEGKLKRIFSEKIQ